MSRRISKGTARKLEQLKQRRETAQAILQNWEEEFRGDFARDGGAQFEPLIKRFHIQTDALGMLEGTVDFVSACAAFSHMDGISNGALLADQRYDALASGASYALTFDVGGRGAARLLVRPEMQSVDLADLFEYPWHRLEVVGYRDIWVTRIDGEDLSMQEVDELDEVMRGDIRFDYCEDEVSIFFDPDTYPGALVVCIYEPTEPQPQDEEPVT